MRNYEKILPLTSDGTRLDAAGNTIPSTIGKVLKSGSSGVLWDVLSGSGGGGGGGTPTLPRLALAVGDSNTEGYGLNSPSIDAWPAKAAPLLTTRYGSFVNLGVSGSRIAGVAARMAAIRALYDFTTYSGVDVFLLIGLNDAGHESATAAAILNGITDLVSQFKQGYTGTQVRVYVLTQFAVTWFPGVGAPASQVTNVIDTWNAGIRLGIPGATGFVDIARITLLQDVNNATYRGGDLVHLPVPGHGLIASAVADNVLSGTQPNGAILTSGGSTTPPTSVPAGPATPFFEENDTAITYAGAAYADDPNGVNSMGNGRYWQPGTNGRAYFTVTTQNVDVYCPTLPASIKYDWYDKTADAFLGTVDVPGGTPAPTAIRLQLVNLVVGHQIEARMNAAYTGCYGYIDKFHQF